MSRQVGFGEEATWGTADTIDHFVEATSESLQLERNHESVEVLRRISPVGMPLLNEIVRGDVVIKPTYDTMGILSKHLIGNVTTTGVGPYVHTFPATTGIPATDRVGLGLTCEIQRDSSLVWTYAGLKIVSWSHTFGVDASSELTVGFLGKSEATGATVTSGTFAAVELLRPPEVSITFDGGSALPATNVSVDVSSEVDEPFILGSSVLGREPRRNAVQRVTISAEVLAENFTDFYTKWDGTSDVDIALTATDGTKSWVYNLNNTRLTQATPHVSGRDRLVATVEGESFFDVAATENLQMVITNDDVSY